MFAGILFALGAGMSWGLAFIAPELLHHYPPALLAFGRYLAFGLIAIPLAYSGRSALKQLTRSDWIDALKLSLVGNILYYITLAIAIQQTGAAIPTMVVGTLPVIITLVSNWLSQHVWKAEATDNHAPNAIIVLPWKKLAPALVIMVLGIALVHHAEWNAPNAAQHVAVTTHNYMWSLFFALIALVCWTYYPIQNARWIQRNPQHSAHIWATAQGITTLPLACFGYIGYSIWLYYNNPTFVQPLGAQPVFFLAVVVVIGLVASWLGTMLWNAASQRLPTQILGQMIVFEALSALAYTYIWRGHVPSLQIFLGIACLVAGVLFALRIKQTS